MSNELTEAHHSQAENLYELLDGSWHNERVLENFRLRFLSGKPYTGVGNAVVALNPCRRLAGLYDRDTQVRFLASTCLFALLDLPSQSG